MTDDALAAFEPAIAARVRALVADLHAGAEPSMADVATRLGVTDRHARRVVARLRETLPVREMRDGRAKRLFLAPDDRRAALADVPLTERQRLALGVAVEAARTALEGTPLADDLDAAAQALFDGAEETFGFDADTLPDLVHFGGEGVAPVPGTVFDTLLTALIERIGVRIDYTNRRGKHTAARPLVPLGLAYRGGSWMLVARDPAHGHEVRHFALADMGAAEVDRTATVVRGGFSLADHFRDTLRGVIDAEVHVVRLRVAPDKVASFRRKLYHPTQQIEAEDADGTATVSFELAGLDDIASLVRSFGAGVVVTDPPALRDRLVADARAVLAQYGA